MDQTSLVERVLGLTLDIEHAAHMADWTEAARLSAQRSPLLKSLTAAQTPQALATVRRIQALDAAVLAQARQAQQELHGEYQAAMTRVKAAGAYQAGARL
jgi:flagellar protein FliT